ncbi:MAG: BatA domain-containing protein [Planctomycetota bacterium]
MSLSWLGAGSIANAAPFAPTLLEFGFINAALAPFLALTSVPLIIYLINRQRYRRVHWAAMEFLLRAMHKNRRRVRLENLLMLIVRTLVVLLFVLGMMRPLMDSGVIADLGGGRRAEMTIIDASYSMGYREAGRSLLTEATELARMRIDQTVRQGDVLGLFVAGGFPESLLNSPYYYSDAGRGREYIDLLQRIDLVYEAFDVPATLEAVAAWITEKGAEGGAAWEIHLYTDLQRRDWLEPDGALRSGVREALDRLTQLRTVIFLHVLGPDRTRNATVAKLEGLNPLVAVDMPTSFQVTVQNGGRETLAGLELELLVDGELRGSRTVQLEPQATVQVSFPYVFRAVGEARVQVQLRSDDLEEDNSRARVIEVRESVRVFLADGGGPDSEDVDFLTAALEPESSEFGGVRLTPYRLDVISADRLLNATLTEAEVLIITNVASLSPAESDAIGAFVARGGGVLLFLGERVQADNYREHAYRDGTYWLPFAPGAALVHDASKFTFGWEIVARTHPAFAFLAENPDAGIGDVAIHGYWKPAVSPPDDAVLVRVKDFDRTPAVVEGRYQDGRVLVVNMGADRTWSNMPVSPAYLCLIQEALPYLSAARAASRNLSIGERYERVIPSEEYAPQVLLFRPGGTGLPLELNPRADQKSFDLRVPAQRQPGLYELRFGGRAGADGATESRWLAFNADPAEGQLERIPQQELADLLPQLKFADSSREAGDSPAKSAPSGELWRLIFYTVLGLLVTESVLARYFSGRSAARAPLAEGVANERSRRP